MKVQSSILEALLTMSEQEFVNDAKKIEDEARKLYMEYCLQEEGKQKKITMHTVKKIYPCIAFYKAVIDCTGQKEKAYSIIERYFTALCNRGRILIQTLCKIPFAYKAVPKIMEKVIHSQYGEESGFKMKEYETAKNECHIDMTHCPYESACTKYGCPELTAAFCNADDITYGNMHPKLSWERKKTLGRGDEYCDFILKIR